MFRLSFRILFAGTLFFLSVAARADQLTFYVYPAPVYIDWTSPTSLAWTTVFANLVTDSKLKAIHAIGHMNFHLQCGRSESLPDGAEIETGQTDSDDSLMNDDLLKNNYGLGEVLTDFPGVWETPDNIEADLPIRYSRGSVAYMNIKISAPSCARVVQYLTEYKTLGYDQIYGGLERKARYRHGAGCSSFAESVLEIVGIMAPEWRSAWARAVSLPIDLIGGPLTGKSVPLIELLFDPIALTWLRPPGDSRRIQFWDPYNAFSWIRHANQNPTSLTGMTYTPSRRGRAPGVEIDATNVPTPTDGFWK